MSSTGEKMPDNIRVRRAKVDSLDLYEVKGEELSTIERGSPASIQLNFALFFIGSFLSLIASLVTADFKPERLFYIFVIVTVVFAVAGSILLVMWLRSHNDVKTVLKTIRDRLPKTEVDSSVAPAIAETADSAEKPAKT